MKSVKPGRGPSMMSGIVGIFMALFGVVWTFAAAGMGAPWFFCLFGVIWTCIVGINTLYSFKNATSKNRYSVIDIVDGTEEPDPLNEYFGEQGEPSNIDLFESEASEVEFCPYCGAEVEKDYRFCHKCGKELPQ